MFIETLNDLAYQSQYSLLTFAEVAGTSSIRVQNTTGLTTSWGIQIGETGNNKTEVAIGTVSAFGSITTSALQFDHPADTKVYFIKYDQVVFERSTTGTAGVAVPITNGTITYQANAQTTKFDDTSGLTTYAYKTYFRNSALAVNSTESVWLDLGAGPSGLSFFSLGGLRQRIKEKLWDATFVSDDELDNWINEHQETMNNAAIAVNEDYSLGTNNYAFGTNGLGTITDVNFKSVRRLWVTYNGSDYHQAGKMFYNDFLPQQIFSSSQPYFSMPGDNVVEIKPADTAGTALIAYYKNSNPLTNDDDLLPFPMRGYSKSFVNYGLAMALQKDGKNKESESVLASGVLPAIQSFKNEIAPRIKTGPTYIRINEATSGGDDGWL